MKPSAVTESPSTFWLSWLTATYQMIDTTPIEIVDTVGVWKRGLTLPKRLGQRPQRAIESARARGRQDRGLRRRRGRAEHGDDQQLVQRRAEDLRAERR